MRNSSLQNSGLIAAAVMAAIAIAGVAPASAADLPARVYTKAPAMAAEPGYDWSGFYAGGHVGGAWGNKD